MKRTMNERVDALEDRMTFLLALNSAVLIMVISRFLGL